MRDRLVKVLTKRRIKGLTFLTVAVMTAMMTYFTADALKEAVSAISLICDMLALCYIFIEPEAGKRTIFKRIQKIMLAVTSAINRLWDRIVRKFSMSVGRAFKGAGLIKDYRDESERISNSINQRRKKRKRKRYKNMDNVEKVRFLYEKKVTGAIRRGIGIEEAMTPSEAGDKMVKKEYIKDSGKVLIENYNEARYNSEAVITDEMVDEAKRV